VGAGLLLGRGGVDVAELIAGAEPVAPDIEVGEQNPYWIRFTSGTTGQPRAFANSHRNITIQAVFGAAEFGYRPDDILLVNAPLAHAALMYALSIIVMGGSIALRQSFDADTVWTECDRLGVTQAFMVPTMLAAAVDSPGEGRTLRGIVVVASMFARSLREKVMNRFPHVDIMEGYGASELGMISVLHRQESERHEGSVGLPRWATRVRILDDGGNDCLPGDVGLIYMQGPAVSGGFTGSVPAPENVFRDGWVTPGDMGFRDEDGYLYLVDRRRDLIISGGFNVYPTEVENAVMEVPGVREVAVVGIPDDLWGHVVTAVVVGTAGASDIELHCRSNLAAYKVPRRIVLVDELPRSSTGKILRRLAADIAVAESSIVDGGDSRGT
jgi:acyl-CoA synthetase (AMP-forming)/AMP-acid ligase II